MFDKNTYHQQYFPQDPPSLQSRAITGNEIQLQYQHNHNIFPGHYLNNPQGLEVTVLFNDYYQDINAGKNGESSSMAGPPQKPSAKKDRHSKIYTSQGPRDRRVRLSIDIARKFFDLQEMLGFDKPSKTLDWLLSKSEEAIQDLVELKSGKSISNSYELEEVVSAFENGNSFGEDSKGKSVMLPKTRNISEKVNLAKESRAKARARARERTKEKMCIKQLNEARIRAHEAPVLHYPISYISTFNQQNSSNGSENWDYSNFGSQSNQLCAILDQHTFIN